MTYSQPLVERLYSLDELVELRRNTLRYARAFPPEASVIATGKSRPPFATFSGARNGCGHTPVKARSHRHTGLTERNLIHTIDTRWYALAAERGREIKRRA
jgi:hypothetical protein